MHIINNANVSLACSSTGRVCLPHQSHSQMRIVLARMEKMFGGIVKEVTRKEFDVEVKAEGEGEGEASVS